MKILLPILFVCAFLYPTYSQDTIHIPNDYSTIQAGINAANNGDIVLVDEGTYYENVVIENKAINLASNFLINADTSYITGTIIDGSQPSNTDSASVIMIFDSPGLNKICGFTLTGGSGKKTVWPNGSFTILGAGVYIQHSSAEIINNYIINNSIYSSSPSSDILGGGIFWGANAFSGFTLRIYGNIIAGNEITGGQTGGGGINISNYVIGGELNYLIEGNTIENNTVTNIDIWKAMGGGIFIDCCLPTVGDQIIRNNIIRNNSVNCSHSFGGGIYFIIRDTDSAGTVDNNPGPYVYNNIISGNYSDYLGGGVSVWRAYYVPPNPATPLQSAGNYVPKPSFINNTIVDNTSPDGSGFFIMNHVPFLMNNIIRNNYPGNAEWGEVFLGDVPYWLETNHYQGVMMFYNDIQGGWEDGDSAEGNIDFEPLFADTLFNLSDSSYCIGNGIDSIDFNGTLYNSPPTDFDGDPRPNPPGSMPDIGAYESPLYSPVYVEKYESLIPFEYTLYQNYPNPFNPSTTIKFSIPKLSFVTLKVYDVLGNEIATLVNEEKPIGVYEIEFSTRNGLASGIYFYQLKAGVYVETKKMIFLK
jgi:hypothetical protein